MLFSRRNLLLATSGIAAASAIGVLPRRASAADKIKIAAIYTVPVEQQWVSRIHKAANAAQDRGDIEYTFSENVSNTDYERVMREYCEAGHQLIVGEVFAVEEAARAVREGLSGPRLPDRLELQAGCGRAEFRGLRQLHPGRVLSDRHHRRRHDQVEEHRHGRRLSDPGGQPADERLHGRREGNRSPTPSSRSPSSAPGSIRRRPRRPPSRRSMPAPT